MTTTTGPAARVEQMLAIANHPRTDPIEAHAALAGARKVVAANHLEENFELRIALIQFTLAVSGISAVVGDIATKIPR